MINKFKNIIFTISFISNFSAIAAQNGVVISEKAIIYADQTLESPIGTIRRGKKVRVGSILRKHGTIAPIVISGRVAWIKVTDLNLNWIKGVNKQIDYNKTPKITEHKVLMIEKPDDDPLKENNILSLQINRFSYNFIVGEDYDPDGNYDPINGYSYHFMFEHRNPKKFFNWGAGLGLFQHSTTDVALSWITLNGVIYLVPIINEAIAFDLFLGVQASGDYRVKLRLSDGTEVETRANSLGGSGGAQIRILPLSKISGLLGVGYQTLVLSDFKSINYDGKLYEMGLDSLSGFTFFIGINFKI